jgi:hypothetical protein
MRRLSLLFLSLLAACASQPPAPAPIPAPAAATAPAIPAGKAAVHIYRRAIPLGPAVLSIYDGSSLVGGLRSGTYLDYYADPGARSLKASGPGASSIPYATTFKAGQSYWLVVYFLGDQARGDASLAPVDAATAEKQMAGLKPADP